MKKVLLSLTLLTVSVLLFATTVYSVMRFSTTLPSFSTIKKTGVEVWWYDNCTNKVQSVDWGIIEPNETKTVQVYVESKSNVPLTLQIYAQAWTPSNATSYMTFAATPNKVTISPAQVIPVTLSLHADISAPVGTSFNFEIMVAGTG